ncbi:MAG: hypothetical protein DMD85_23905, partial [Candidatus Rokuibacteriota bacterium]
MREHLESAGVDGALVARVYSSFAVGLTFLIAGAPRRTDLEHAVMQLDLLPAVDVHSVALAAHALNSFLTVSGGVVELLLPVLRHHPDRQVTVWLEGLAHANDLM